MAKGKKKENLTPEERLQVALVPTWEQPYKVPENWCWTKLSSLSNLISKGTTPKGGKSSYSNKGVKFLRVENINDDGTISHDNIAYVSEETHKTFLKRSILEENDILISIAGTLGKTGIVRSVDLPMNTNQAVAFVRTVSDRVNVKYIKNSIDSPVIQDLLLRKTKVTSIPNLTLEIIGECPIPLPPLPEQQRIVDRIDSLFAKLDEAKQKAQDALDSFETRKAAILHKAFTGELTAQWRKEHDVGMESWNKTILKDVCKVNPKKIDTNRLPDDLEVSFFPMASLSEIYGEITEPQTRLLKEVKKGFTNFLEGDVVFAKITPCMENGKSAIIENLVNGIGYGTTEFYVLRCNENLYNRYLYHMVRDTSFRHKAKAVMSGAVGQQRVPKSFMENYPLDLPSVPEQIEIVLILEDFFTKEQQAKEAAEAVLEQIDLIKKSILARAFRGELGTNDPTEESAVELVKEVIEKSAEINNKPKTRTKRTVIPGEIKSALSNSNEEEIVRLLIKSVPKAVSVQTIMSISKKKFELIDALRSLERKQIVIQNSLGEYLLKR